MGQFSWFTQDTSHRIVNGEEHRVIMTDNKGVQYIEHCYQGYGMFGGKDYHELLAEMNGLGSDREAGIVLAFKNSPSGENPDCIHPSLTESGTWMGGIAPKPDPDQGFQIWDDDDNDEDSYDEF